MKPSQFYFVKSDSNAYNILTTITQKAIENAGAVAETYNGIAELLAAVREKAKAIIVKINSQVKPTEKELKTLEKMAQTAIEAKQKELEVLKKQNEYPAYTASLEAWLNEQKEGLTCLNSIKNAPLTETPTKGPANDEEAFFFTPCSLDGLTKVEPVNSYLMNNLMEFLELAGDIKPSKTFLNTPFGVVFEELRKSSASFADAIAKYENSKKFNLTLEINDKEVKKIGGGGITRAVSVIPKFADVVGYFLSTTTAPQDTNYKFTEIGIALIVMHEVIHQKIALSTKNDDDAHNSYNTELQTLINILSEFNTNKCLGLSNASIKALAFSGQQDSKAFEEYINGLAKANKRTFEDEKAKYDTMISNLIYKKKNKK